MAFPSQLSVARLRALWLKADGSPSPGILSISSSYYTGVGDAIITTAPFEVRLTDGNLDVPVPIGDDADLTRPMYLDITSRINGTDVKHWTVQITTADVETVTENGGTVKVVRLNKKLVVDGIPIFNLGLVKSVNGVSPDAAGNVLLSGLGGVSDATLTSRLLDYAKTSAVASAISSALTAYTPTTGLGQVIRDRVAAFIVAGPGVTTAYDPQAGTLTLTGTGTGSGAVSSVAGKTGAVTLSKTDVGLDNVSNTADADKPVSTATQTALNAKASTSAVTTSAAGLMSAADKTKLNGVATGATANSTDTTLLNRQNHTGSQPISSVTNLQSTLDTKIGPDDLEVVDLAAFAALSPDALLTGAIDRSDPTKVTASAAWPDGATGTFVGAVSSEFYPAVDGFFVTHTLGGDTVTYTQPTVTRDRDGVITSRPAITIAAGAPAIPPTALTLTAVAGDGKVTLTPSGGVGRATYALYRGTSASGTLLTSTFGSFVDTGRANGTAVDYYAVATNSDGSVAATATTTPIATPIIPGAGSITATPGAGGSGQITVTGSGATSVATRALYRSTSFPVDTTGTPVATALPFTDTGRTAGTTYYYQLVVASSTGNTASSNTVNASVAAGADTTAPTAPTTVTATAGPNSATLTMDGATDDTAVTGYRAYSAASGGTKVAEGTSPLAVTGLTAGTARTFYVSAIDAAGNESGRTASNSVTPTAAGTYPAAGTVFLSDTFTATDGTAIEGRTLSEGTVTTKAWAHATDARFLVNSNRARAATGPTGNAAFALVDTGFTKHRITATFAYLHTTQASRKTGIVSAFVDSANNLRLDANSGTWLLRKIIGGAATTLLTGPTAVAGDVAELITAADGTLTVVINAATVSGTAVLPSELAAATKAGMYGQPTAGSTGGTVQDQLSAIADIKFTAV